MAKNEVFGHGEGWHQHEVLVHHANARANGVTRGGELNRPVIDQYLAGIGFIQTIQNIHEGAFAGPVFA